MSSFCNQTAKFLATVAQSMPELSGDVMQGWIENPRSLQKFLLGLCPPVNHVIDCDADPFVPEGWKVEEHKKSGKIKWAKELIQLYLSAGQKDGKFIEGNKLRKELASKPVLNANVLDYLLAHPELIPEEWKGKCVFFWGTIYRYSDGGLDVRYLYWDGGRWDWDYFWLGHGFYGNDPAALSASI